MKSKGKVLLGWGISFLFIGMKSLGTLNYKAPNRASLKATRRLVAISRMGSLHKCPSQVPRVTRSLKEFEKLFKLASSVQTKQLG